MKPQEILKEFEKIGVLARSVQAHRPQLFPVDAPDYKVKTLEGVPRQCFSLLHPAIRQPLYQMSPVDEKGRPVDPNTLEAVKVANIRGMALLLSWPRTWRSIVDAALADASSGSTFNKNDVLPTKAGQVEEMIMKFIPQAAKAGKQENNEVRTIAIGNVAVVGFVFAPTMESPLNKCKPTWKETKELFTAYASKIRQRAHKTNPVGENEFAVFTYSLTKDRMLLTPIDVIVVK